MEHSKIRLIHGAFLYQRDEVSTFYTIRQPYTWVYVPLFIVFRSCFQQVYKVLRSIWPCTPFLFYSAFVFDSPAHPGNDFIAGFWSRRYEIQPDAVRPAGKTIGTGITGHLPGMARCRPFFISSLQVVWTL